MESLLVNKHNGKSKKRKTRKTLDALRNRKLQSLLRSDRNKENEIETNSKNKNLAAKASNFITTNRLTLFKKAVSSNIVSRKMICEEKNKKKVKNNLNENSDFLTNTVQSAKEGITVVSDDSSNKCVSHVSDKEHTQDIVIRDTGERTPNSIILFSPLLKNKDSDCSENLQMHTQQSDDRSSDTDSLYNLQVSENNFYEDFMNFLPKYLQKTVPQLTKKNCIYKYIRKVEKLIVKEHNLVNEEPSPLQYDSTLKYSDYECNNQLNVTSHSSQSVSHNEISSSPSVSTPSDSTLCKSRSPLSVLIPDSPEYYYYPHKLNQ